MDEIIDAAALADTQGARSDQLTPDGTFVAPAPTSEIGRLLEEWRAHWYPDAAAASHPAPPFSGAWHHARDAFEDLKARVGAL